MKRVLMLFLIVLLISIIIAKLANDWTVIIKIFTGIGLCIFFAVGILKVK